MSQNTSIESSTRSSPNPSINPALQAALSSIDVQLEEELARYRRQRAGRPVTSPRGLGRHQVRKPIDLISVDKADSQTQPQSLAKLPPASAPTFPLPLVNPTPAAAPPRETPSEPLAQIDRDRMDTPAVAASESADASDTPWNNGYSTPEESITGQAASTEESQDVSSDLMHSPAPQSPPEDYLESSEQLLRSLAEEEATNQPQKRFADTLLTPLSVGLMLLVLLSSATMVYIATNPSTLKALGLDRFFGSKTPTTAQSPTETTQARVEPVNPSPTLEGPNLAAEEFPEVDLDSLSHLKSSPGTLPPSPSPSSVPSLPDLPNTQAAQSALPVAPNPPVAERSSDLSAALLTPSVQPNRPAAPTTPPVVSIPAPAATPRASTPSSTQAKPSPAPARSAAPQMSEASPAPAQVATSEVPLQDNYYRVLINYNSDRTLEQARTVVPDAYVINLSEGARIQMGAFQKESEAQSLVEQLRQQGISASINRP